MRNRGEQRNQEEARNEEFSLWRPGATTESKFSRTLKLVPGQVELLEVHQLPKLAGDGACALVGEKSIEFCCVGLVLHNPHRSQNFTHQSADCHSNRAPRG